MESTSTRNFSAGLGFSQSIYDPWGAPVLVDTIELVASIEFIYKQRSSLSYGWNPPAERVYKIVFSCVEGKWNKSEPIYGRIVPASSEYYTF